MNLTRICSSVCKKNLKVNSSLSVFVNKELLHKQNNILMIRYYAKSNKEQKLVKRDDSGTENQVQMSLGETVKETTKTVSYLGVILAGIGVTSLMIYAIFSELFSSKSPNSVYTKAFNRCLEDNHVKDSLGEPIKGYGEETRRGRRRHTSHAKYEKDGQEYLRMVFYLKGSRKTGTVHLEMMEDSKGAYVFRYLFVQLDDYTKRIIVVEDNRAIENIGSDKNLMDVLQPEMPIRDTDISSPLNLS